MGDADDFVAGVVKTVRGAMLGGERLTIILLDVAEARETAKLITGFSTSLVQRYRRAGFCEIDSGVSQLIQLKEERWTIE
jgi:hypothetical protein